MKYGGNKLASGVVFCIMLGACAPLSPEQQPAPVAPTQWQEQVGAGKQDDLQLWWQRFHDPDLDKLVSAALQSSLDLKQAQARIEQARADLAAVGAAQYPDINVAATVTRSDSGNNVSGSATALAAGKPVTLYRAGFDASWEVDWFGRIREQVSAAQARYEASVDDARDVRVILLGDVASEYIALRNSQQQRLIARENIEAQQHVLELTQERFRRGLTAYLDVAEAQTQLATTQATLPVYDAQAKQSMRALAILLGYTPGSLPLTLDDSGAVPAVDAVAAAGLPSGLLARRPDLRSEERRLAAAAADVGVAKAERYPSLDLTFGLGLQSHNDSTLTDIGSRYWSVVPGLKLPVLDGGRISANIDSKQARYEEARYHYQASFNRALQDVENALSGFYAEDARCDSLRQSAAAAATAVELAQQRYASGIDNFLNVIVSQRALYNAQSSLAQAEANRSTQAVALYKAMGGGWQ